MNCKPFWRGIPSRILCLHNSISGKCSVCPHPWNQFIHTWGAQDPVFILCKVNGSQQHREGWVTKTLCNSPGALQAMQDQCRLAWTTLSCIPAAGGFERASRRILVDLCWFRAAGDQPDFAKRGQINGLNFAWLFPWTHQWITSMVLVLFSGPAEAPSHPGH